MLTFFDLDPRKLFEPALELLFELGHLRLEVDLAVDVVEQQLVNTLPLRRDLASLHLLRFHSIRRKI